MTSLIFATNNINKVNEVQAMLHDKFRVISLKEAGINIDIPEPHDTLEANASEKSMTIFRMTGKDCFSEDTGLEVEALGGKPGVRSARFTEEGEPFADNIEKLLSLMDGHTHRKARFRTVISLIIDGAEYLFEGICEGIIINERIGDGGFGYDSIFVPDGSELSFASMTMEEKNKFSHRKKAMSALMTFIQSEYGKN